MWRRADRNSRSPMASTSTPDNRTEPDVGSTSRTTDRPVLDLPHPDSPTNPSVSPAEIEKLTPDTACTVDAPRRNNPPPAEYSFTRSTISSTASLIAALTPATDGTTTNGRPPPPTARDATRHTIPPRS